jgi:hypothetical protein
MIVSTIKWNDRVSRIFDFSPLPREFAHKWAVACVKSPLAPNAPTPVLDAPHI